MKLEAAAVFVAVLAAVSCMGTADRQPVGELLVTTLSSRPDMVSGGDALIEVKQDEAPPAGAVITVDGRDVSSRFLPDESRGALVGLVDGLRPGRNTVEVRTGALSASLELHNHPRGGPIVAGDHLTPYECRTEEAGLGAPLDAECSAPTKIEYFYRSTEPAAGGGPGNPFKPLTSPRGPRPADVATTTTRDGRTVPFIVRVESGTINRAIYRIAVLDDPAADDDAVEWAPGAAWNRRLMVTFLGGCGTNYNQGAAPMQAALSEPALSRGFAHIVSSQNGMFVHCDDHRSGEALMMIKEHFIERYGVPDWTVGSGSSGGAIQQLLIAQNFPGLLDGLMPRQAYPDSISNRPGVTDCRLLGRYFDADPTTWTPQKRGAVEGYSPGTCDNWDRNYVDIIVADHAEGCGIEEDLVYHPTENPTGARCTIWDTNVATFGRDPATGFARRSLDNVGVQYGLAALNDGVITPAEFIDLNANVGGFDNDGHVRPERTVANPEAVRLAYAAGRVSTMIGLDAVPILQLRTYLDEQGDIHSRDRDFVIRERLRQATGQVDTQVMWLVPAPADRSPGAVFEDGTETPIGMVIDTMSEWLDALVNDASAAAAADKVLRAKPAAATDTCWDADLASIAEPASFDAPGRCNELYPTHATPRLVAGAPLRDDVLKCRLGPIDPDDYAVAFSADELDELRSVFPDGVCDYSRPGVSEQPAAGTYLRLPLR